MGRVYTRLDMVRHRVDEMLLAITDDNYRRDGYVHLYGSGFAAAVIALKRGHNTEYAEFANIAGILHDYISYENRELDNHDHAHLCEPIVRKLLIDLEIFIDSEIEMICSAVYNHSDKDVIGSEFDEIIKDADIMHHWLRNPIEQPLGHEIERVKKLSEEFGFSIKITP